MCGIVAFIQINSSVSQAALIAATQSLIHRGPDAQGTIILANQQVGLGATRLQLVDLTDKSNQPFQKNNVTLVFNGEIYNFRSIKKLLEEEGCQFRTTGDTEVVITAVEQWGIKKALQSFRGSFVFTIYDANTNQVHVARDIFGERQLVYKKVDHSTWLFASEVKALNKHPAISLQPDLDGLAGLYLMGLFNDPQTTFFQGVNHFPPAHFLTIDINTNQAVFEKYWNHENILADSSLTKKDVPQLSQKIIELLADSVNMQCDAHVPIASLLSGGIDSSLITVLAHDHIHQTHPTRLLDCITAYYAKGGSHDYAQVKKLLHSHSHLQLQHAQFPSEITDEQTNQLTFHNEAPLLELLEFALYQNYKTAHDLNYKTVLNGQGSDELWFGYYHFYDFMKKTRPTNPVRLLNTYFKDNHYFFDYNIADISKKRYENIIGKTISQYFPKTKENYQDQIVKFFYATYLQGQLRCEDRFSMMTSVEVRLPFLYQELIELSFQIPAKLKHLDEQSKYLLRLAAKNTLPQSIRTRAKTPFPLPLHKFHKEITHQSARQKVVDSNLVAETFQLTKQQINDIYKQTNSDIRIELFFLQSFEKVFFA